LLLIKGRFSISRRPFQRASFVALSPLFVAGYQAFCRATIDLYDSSLVVLNVLYFGLALLLVDVWVSKKQRWVW